MKTYDIATLSSKDPKYELIENLKTYKNEFNALLDSENDEIDPFWVRKSDQSVLAVVMVRINGKLEFFRSVLV